MEKKEKIFDLIKLLRINQYHKNLLIFLPLLFSGNVLNFNLLFKNFLGFISFSLTASVGYIINDYLDKEKDRLHPYKKSRPFAKGSIKKFEGLLLLIITTIISFSIAFFINPPFFFVLLIYLLIANLYNFFLKNIFILDTIILVFLYIVRVIAGSSITGIKSSAWLIFITFLASLIIILSKRYSEPQEIKKISRPSNYFVYENNILKVIFFLNIFLFISYFLYIIYHLERLGYIYFINFPLFVLFFLRYFKLTKERKTEAPEKFYQDKIMLTLFILQLFIIFISLYS